MESRRAVPKREGIENWFIKPNKKYIESLKKEQQKQSHSQSDKKGETKMVSVLSDVLAEGPDQEGQGRQAPGVGEGV